MTWHPLACIASSTIADWVLVLMLQELQDGIQVVCMELLAAAEVDGCAALVQIRSMLAQSQSSCQWRVYYTAWMMCEWQPLPFGIAFVVSAHDPCALRSIGQCDLHGLFVAVDESLVAAECIALYVAIPFDIDLVFF